MSTFSTLCAMVLRWTALARLGIGALWRSVRTVSGDDAYERYLAHHAAAHGGETPLTRKMYFAERQRQKWSGVTRCC